jgi:hexosaminidase
MAAGCAWAAAPALVPRPQILIQTNAGAFTLCPPQVIRGARAPAPTPILVDNGARETGEYLAASLFRSTGYRFLVGTNSGGVPVAQAILLSTNGALTSLGTEGYELTIATNAVFIRAPTSAGLFYGVQTLLQLLPPDIYSPRPVTGVPWTAPCLYIQDWPRFSWRGYMLDSVRHFFTVDEVKQLIDSMVMHKLNVFHWHLDDDSGWRLEIQKYPLLTAVGAWRSDIMFGLNPRSTQAWNDTNGYGGFYTQAEARDIVAYAAQRHILVVPEIEMPGHSSAVLAAYPYLSCNGTNSACPTCANTISLNVTSYSGGVFCIAKPETTNFLHDVLTEVMAIFPGPYIHIGGDEVSFGNWSKHSLDIALTNSLGLASTPGGASGMQKYQGWFAQNIANWLKSQGRTMMGWSEIMNGGTLTNCALMDWLNTKAVQAATNKEYVVMENSAVLYLNKWETANNSSGGGVVWSNEPPGQSGLVLLTNVYAYEPLLSTIPAAFTNYILGAEGPCWAEHIPSLLNMEFRMYPRLSAVAEVDWTLPGLKNWTDFTNRLAFHQLRLEKAGINYNPYGTPPQLGTWNPAVVPASYSVRNWNISSLLTNAGEFTASFCSQSGANALDIAYVALLENGVEIDRDAHSSSTGPGAVIPPRPYYILRLPAWRPGAIYTLSASVQGHGGTDSTGVIYRPNWD